MPNPETTRLISALAGCVLLTGVVGTEYYRWQDGQGVPRCLPWQTVDDGCDQYNRPCPPEFGPGKLCTRGKLFYPGEIGATGWWHHAWFASAKETNHAAE